MNYGGAAPSAGLAATGLATGQTLLVLTAVALVVLGAVLVKLTFRRGKAVGDI